MYQTHGPMNSFRCCIVFLCKNATISVSLFCKVEESRVEERKNGINRSQEHCSYDSTGTLKVHDHTSYRNSYRLWTKQMC